LARSRVFGDRRADLSLHRLHCGRAVGGDPVGGLERPRHEPLSRRDAIDQPDPRRRARHDHFGRHQQLHRVDVADDLLDELDGRAAGCRR
jgi:hypothetical protein